MKGGAVAARSWRVRLGQAHDAVTRVGFMVAAGCLAIIVCAYSYEVVARYFFAAPTIWAGALVSYALSALVFLAIPELTRRQSHVVINIFVERLPPKGARHMRRAVRVVAGAACLFAAWFSGDASIAQYSRGIQTITAWPIPKWPLSMLIPYGLLSSSLYFLRHALSDAPAAAATEVAG